MYNHWFVSRQKRQLIDLLPALVIFNDICAGEVWKSNSQLQLKFEDELAKQSVTSHGTLRARRTGMGGGGVRTLMKQMQDLGLVFIEEESGKCRLTLAAEAIIKGDLLFVDAMTLQLQRYQYPSATSCKGSGAIESSFKIHPFQFLMRLLLDNRLDHYLNTEEIAYIVIHNATSDDDNNFEEIIKDILSYRAGNTEQIDKMKNKEKHKSFYDIANTFINYLFITGYIEKGHKKIFLRKSQTADAQNFVQKNPKFLPNPEYKENYIRAYGRGTAAKDHRRFGAASRLDQKAIEESRMRSEYLLLSVKKPVTGITNEVIEEISKKTGLDARKVEAFLKKTYPQDNANTFFAAYKVLAVMGQAGALEFEKATCEIFKVIFGLNTVHVGPIGNTPDVYVEASSEGWGGIIDTKSYRGNYSVTGDQKRRMIDVYIPEVNKYGSGKYPLAFFSYIAESFGKNINSQILEIYTKTRVQGSAMPVDVFIRMAEDYATGKINLEKVRELFALNKEVQFSDL